MLSQTTPRRRSLLLTLLLPAVLLGGCGPSGSPSSSSSDTSSPSPSPGATPAKKYRLGCTIPTFGHPFFVAMKKGIDEESAAQGASINVVDGKDDPQTQVSAVDTFLVQKVDTVLLCPTESGALAPEVEKANQEKIPVVTVNRTVQSGNVVTYVGADDTDGGRMQGEALMKALPHGGNILLLEGVLGSSPQRNREAGLEAALKGHPEYHIVQKVPYKFQRTLAVPAMEAALLQYPKGKLDAVVAQSDDGALAAADVCGQKGRNELVLIGFNGESDAFDAIRKGKIYATILQDAETQGREAVKAAIANLKGEKVQNPKITPLYTVTKENIDKYKPAWESSKS